MTTRALGYPIVSQETLTQYMAQYLSTEESRMTAEQFAAAGIQAHFLANPIEGEIADAVSDYLAENGSSVSAAQVQEAVAAYYSANPDSVVTNDELAAAIAAYLQAHPPQPGATGPAGQNATDEQVAEAVAAYLDANPIRGSMNGAVAAYMAANREALRGPSGATLLGTVTISETAVLAIAAGTRRVTINTPPEWGVEQGQNLLLFPVSVPSQGYATHDVIVTANNRISVGITTPLISALSSYSISARLVRINT